MPTIVVVDPQHLTRLGLVQLLSDVEPNCTVIGADYADTAGKAASPEHTVELILLAVNDFLRVHDLVAQVTSDYSPQAVILMADEENMPDIAFDLPASVKGYISRFTPSHIIRASVSLVLIGGNCYPRSRPSAIAGGQPDHNGRRYDALHNPQADESDSLIQPGLLSGDADGERGLLGLTARQYEVLTLLARGYSMKMIGRQLKISTATAKSHLNAIYQRLGVHNSTAAVFAATNKGAMLNLLYTEAAERAPQNLYEKAVDEGS
jgi:DNA-binding NarL/FixJ family response regulator